MKHVKHFIFPLSLGLVLGIVILLTISSCMAKGSETSLSSTESTKEDAAWIALHPKEYRSAILEAQEYYDTILSLYRNDQSKEDVIAFFDAILHSRELAQYLLFYAEKHDVSPSLAAALAWEESRYDPLAINRNKASIDRGLFQLNSRSFPNLTEDDFFDPGINTRYGLAHLRWCLDLAGSEVAALAMYNAGTTRVRQDGTPKKTLDYVSRIQAFRDGLEALFEKELSTHWIVADGTVLPVPSPEPQASRLAAVRFPLLNNFR